MLAIRIERIGEQAVVECEGRVVRSEASVKLREAVTSLRNARNIVLDLSVVLAIEDAGLGRLDIAIFHEMMELPANADRRYALAA
jgi:anti-anti-sigma regulatory factor